MFRFLKILAVAAIGLAALSPLPALAADDAVTIGLDWRAEPAFGGLYQALAAGIYKKHHLDVRIVQGGPNLNQAQLLAAGRYDFSIQSNSFEPLNFVQSGIPIVIVAAGFQKDPQVLIAHPGAGNDTLAALKGKPLMISQQNRNTWWQFLRLRFGFSDDQLRGYNYSLTPFLVDKSAVMQGYLTDEPYAIELKTGEKPVTLLLADQGYTSYAEMIATTAATIAAKPDLVQRFVSASMEGWKSYLTENPGPANELIKRDNPEMTDPLLAHARSVMIQYGMVTSGDAQRLGIGAMTDARWKNFFDLTTKAGIYPATLDYKRAYTLRFVDQHAETR